MAEESRNNPGETCPNSRGLALGTQPSVQLQRGFVLHAVPQVPVSVQRELARRRTKSLLDILSSVSAGCIVRGEISRRTTFGRSTPRPALRMTSPHGSPMFNARFKTWHESRRVSAPSLSCCLDEGHGLSPKCPPVAHPIRRPFQPGHPAPPWKAVNRSRWVQRLDNESGFHVRGRAQQIPEEHYLPSRPSFHQPRATPPPVESREPVALGPTPRRTIAETDPSTTTAGDGRWRT